MDQTRHSLPFPYLQIFPLRLLHSLLCLPQRLAAYLPCPPTRPPSLNPRSTATYIGGAWPKSCTGAARLKSCNDHAGREDIISRCTFISSLPRKHLLCTLETIMPVLDCVWTAPYNVSELLILVWLLTGVKPCVRVATCLLRTLDELKVA